MWSCVRCNQSFPECEYRYILSFLANDHTGAQWIGTFNDQANTLMGKPASELMKLQEANDATLDQCFDDANFRTYTFRVSAKLDTYRDESTVKHNLSSLTPLDFSQAATDLISLIQRYQ
jgi:replication factor A1